MDHLVAYKCNLRHRMHSKKWHQVYKEALRRGVSQDRAKVQAALVAKSVWQHFQKKS